MKKILTIGESMALLWSSAPGPLRFAKELGLGFGGAEGNVALALARQGHPVAWLSRVGDDEFGRLITNTMRGEGVEVFAKVDGERSTGLMIRETKRTDYFGVTYYRANSAAAGMKPEDLDVLDMSEYSLVHTSGISHAISGSARETVREAVKLAKAAGAKVSFDVNYRSALWSHDDAWLELAVMLPKIDILFGGLDEMHIILDDNTLGHREAAAAIRAKYGCDVVVKLGAAGAYALTAEGEEEAPGFKIELASPIGAGDAFVAGYLSGLIDGLSLRERLVRGNATGAWVASGIGDWESAPTKAGLGMLTEGDVVR